MIFDNAVFENASDIVAPTVSSLDANAADNSIVYLISGSGTPVSGLYIKANGQWLMISNGDVVAD